MFCNILTGGLRLPGREPSNSATGPPLLYSSAERDSIGRLEIDSTEQHILPT